MRKQGWVYWQVGLQEGSQALSALDAYAKKLGMTRGEASRVLLIQWSEGQLRSTPTTAAPVVPTPRKNKNGSSAAAALDLDL
jgi:hypothetical protein